MVVFEDGIAKKAHYRKFGVRDIEGQDDFAAMAEVVSRRFARLAAGAPADDYDGSFAATPNLVVIDGGKGQRSAGLAARQEFDLPRVAVIALAKRVEEVFLPGRGDPVVLPEHSPGRQLLQRIRDEAHRFAVTFHRQRRDAASRESMFDQLPGVGPARRRALLRHFGSAERVLAASETAPNPPQVAITMHSKEPLVESALWVDDLHLFEKGGGSPTNGTIYGAPANPLDPGTHVAVGYARTAFGGSVVAWTFRVPQ